MTTNQINYQRLLNDRRVAQETERSNRAKEFETNRSNIAHETETNRHNIQDETTKSKAQKSKSFKDYASGARDITGILESVLNPTGGVGKMVTSIFGL